MYVQLTMAERLKDLRVIDKKLTLEQLAESGVRHHFTEQAVIDLPAAQQLQYFITQMQGCHVHI